MNPAAKLGGFALVLALVFGGATLAGRALDPFGDPTPMPTHDVEHGTTTTPHGPSTTAPAPHGTHEEHP